jgi:coproporphyrinogen III oxidase-like Fe-S oxidoreductase
MTRGDGVMLQETETIRHYQKITDAAGELWNRGYRFEDIRMYLDGYLAALRTGNGIEAYQISRLEEEAVRYIYDPSNFEVPQLQRAVDYR